MHFLDWSNACVLSKFELAPILTKRYYWRRTYFDKKDDFFTNDLLALLFSYLDFQCLIQKESRHATQMIAIQAKLLTDDQWEDYSKNTVFAKDAALTRTALYYAKTSSIEYSCLHRDLVNLIKKQN